ncbi:LysR family transcriptional regulator [Arenibaculum pallidiluteum]|uniref:LysR family transcriptional regulator n=1 Tax=Arenibaculum pallidiluteum TaxID=2812559 RepID=UPI001A95A6CC|nr:LysR family transcriptional regulator [Arenibaculum pallidiluteum]
MLDDLAIFCRVAESRSVAAAARALGAPKATVSRRLSALEKEIGTPLVHRSTRAVSLTHAGRELYSQASCALRAALAAIADAQSAAPTGGLVRLTAPAAFGQTVLLPHILAFQARHPDVRVALDLSDARLPLVEQGVDLAVRVGPLENSWLRSRRLCTVAMRVVASPAYLARAGTPTTIDALQTHDCVALSSASETWAFEQGDRVRILPIRWRLSICGMTALSVAAAEGAGVTIIPDFLADPLIAEGRLVSLTLDGVPSSAPVTALYPGSGAPSPATRRLLEHIVLALRRRPAPPGREPEAVPDETLPLPRGSHAQEPHHSAGEPPCTPAT